MLGYETDAPYLDKDDQDLYQGTAKAAEGLAAEHVFALAKQDTMHIVVHWQDADSTAHFPACFRQQLKFSAWPAQRMSIDSSLGLSVDSSLGFSG